MRMMAAAVALAFATSCAVILHPERKGNNSTPIDTVPLVVDILLFLPGLIPGVVALVLDFGTGAIYLEKNGANKPFLGKRKRRNEQRLQVRVVDDEGKVLQERALTVKAPKRSSEPLALSLPDLTSADWAGQDVHLEITSETGEPVVVSAL